MPEPPEAPEAGPAALAVPRAAVGGAPRPSDSPPASISVWAKVRMSQSAQKGALACACWTVTKDPHTTRS